ncbi:MAG TPA: hypothetical protein PK536_03865 [Ignavibacteria bacterium]|nr:hypothetical protein [Bacteroidota bacterium]HRI84562.1 hypothetical protein [Ignavibacteria bacterium]HRJ98530.1 hypothetical protein [Ignavibacteria bacterium]
MSNQKWKKLGLMYAPDGKSEWMHTHAMMPVLVKRNNDEARIFFSARDVKGRSQGAFIDIDLNDPFRILRVSDEPVLRLGQLGAFDDAGIMPTSCVSFENKEFLYYNGWTLGKNVPFFSFNGAAVSKDGGENFKKISRGPAVLYSNDIDPYSTFAPFVINDEGKLKMWYVSLIKWTEEDGELKHYYNIRYAESSDGINWDRNGQICIDFKNEFEYAIARPFVLKEEGIYKMWYSYRESEKNKTYRIGYAESPDGKSWQRMDDAINLEVSDSGWDSEMIEYSFIYDFKGKRYMLYNGNSFGRTGMGLAELEV